MNNSTSSFHRFRAVFVAMSLAAAVWTASAQTPRGAPVKEKEQPLLDNAQVAKLREYSVVAADKLIEYHQKEIKQIKGRQKPFPGDAETLKKNESIIEYAVAYKARLQARQEILDYQERCRKEKIDGPEAIDKLNALDKTAQDAAKRMGELTVSFKKEFGLDIPDPYRLVLDKIFPPEPLK